MLYVIIAINKVGMEISSQEIDKKGFSILFNEILYLVQFQMNTAYCSILKEVHKISFKEKLVGTPIMEQKN